MAELEEVVEPTPFPPYWGAITCQNVFRTAQIFIIVCVGFHSLPTPSSLLLLSPLFQIFDQPLLSEQFHWVTEVLDQSLVWLLYNNFRVGLLVEYRLSFIVLTPWKTKAEPKETLQMISSVLYQELNIQLISGTPGDNPDSIDIVPDTGLFNGMCFSCLWMQLIGTLIVGS